LCLATTRVTVAIGMPSMKTRGRAVKQGGLAALLAAAALVLSGCPWGKVYGPSDGHRIFVISGDASDRIILQCGGINSSCIRGTVFALCENFPRPRLSLAECRSFTWPDHWDDVERAARRVIGPDADCLAVHIQRPSPEGVIPYDWFSLPLGTYGCVRSFATGGLPGTT
jgi:hypothetical protein